jgi:transposase
MLLRVSKMLADSMLPLGFKDYPAETIALHTATSLWFVYHTVSDYNRLGPASIEEDRRGGRQHAYLTEDEECAFLEPFIAKAEAGELVTTRAIQQAFEERVGQSVHSGTIYGHRAPARLAQIQRRRGHAGF